MCRPPTFHNLHNKARWFVRLGQSEGGERQRESGAGSRVKGGADPGRARGSQRPSTGQEGSASDGGPRFNRDVKCDKDGSDKLAERSGFPRPALCRPSRPALPSSAFTSSLLLL